MSDTIPPDLFYPNFINQPESKLKIRLINQALTHTNNNIVHFLSTDCKLTTPVSKLLLDLNKIDENSLKIINLK